MKLALVLALLATLPAQTVPSGANVDSQQTLRDVEVLSADDMEGRAPGTPGGARARDYILRRFAETGLRSFGGSHLKPVPGGANIIGYIEGTDRTGRYLVVTAHYDHLGVRLGRVYNGANDNASGVAGMLALAAYFKAHPPKNGIIFAALDREETTGSGGRTLVNAPPVSKASMVMNINIDMIARAPDNKLFAVGTYHYPCLKPYIAEIAGRTRVNLLMGHDRPGPEEDWSEDSDHVWFHRAKIPFVYFGVEDFEQHHAATDDFHTITPGFFIQAVETVLDALKVFDANLATIRQACY